MKDILYSPWRMKYVAETKETKCVFCLEKSRENDEKHLVLFRSKHSFVIMNLYPYNNGHLLVVPFRHVSRLDELDQEESKDFFDLLQETVKVIDDEYHPDGLNLGMNIGKAGGAGIEQHLHAHIVPRWEGDANFMTSISGTRVIPEEFEKSYKRLKEQFDKRDV